MGKSDCDNKKIRKLNWAEWKGGWGVAHKTLFSTRPVMNTHIYA